MDSALIREALRLLDRARLIAEAPAAQLVQVGHGHPDSGLPSGLRFTVAGNLAHAPATLEQLGDRVNAAIAAGSEEQLRGAIAWGDRELRSLTHGPPDRQPETHAEFRGRVCRAYEGQLAGVVAREENSTVTTIRKLRVEDGRDPRWGRKLKAVGK